MFQSEWESGRGRCVRGLREEHYLVIASRVVLGKGAAAAASVGYSESHWRRLWDQAREMVLLPAGLRGHDDLLMGMWMASERDCCAARAFELLADERFSA